MLPAPFRIRPCLAADIAAAYHVCLKTGDSGQDGTHLYADDPDALGNIYVGPYIVLEPSLAFVLEDDQGVCGYVLAALDSVRFYARMLTEWLPPLRARFPAPTGDPASWTPTQKLYYEYHHYEPYFPPLLHPYPAHAHIDLLARAQGQGLGRRMMRHIMAELTSRGSPGVHLAVSVVNHRAYAFYQKLGFRELSRVGTPVPEAIVMARPLPYSE